MFNCFEPLLLKASSNNRFEESRIARAHALIGEKCNRMGYCL